MDGVRFVERQAFTPPARKVRVGNGRAANHDGIGVAVGHECQGFIPGGHYTEAGVHQERAVETLAQVLHEFTLGIMVEDAEVGEVERGDGVHQDFIGGADIGGVGLGDPLDVVLRGNPDAHPVGAQVLPPPR